MPKENLDVKQVIDDDDPFGPSDEDAGDILPEDEDGQPADSEASKPEDSTEDVSGQEAETKGKRENERVRQLVDENKELKGQLQELLELVVSQKNQPPPKAEPDAKDIPPWRREDWEDRLATEPGRAFDDAMAWRDKHESANLDERFKGFATELQNAMRFLGQNPEFAKMYEDGSLQREQKRRGLDSLYTTYLVVENENLKKERDTAKADGYATGREKAAADQRLKKQRAPALTDSSSGQTGGREDLSKLDSHDWAMAIADKLNAGAHLPRRRRG